MAADGTDHPRHDATPEQPEKKEDGQPTDAAPDRAQSELTEQNLLQEQLSEAQNPGERDALEGELGEMEDDIEDANQE
jgi:hypothetical protein